MSIPAPDPVALHARGQGHRLAVHDVASGRRWSYAALHETTQRAMTWLRNTRRITCGDRVAIRGVNSAEHVILALALARLGAIFVPLNTRLANAELARILDDCAPRLLVTNRPEALPALPAGCLAVGHDEAATAMAQAECAPSTAAPEAEAVQLLLYTSGTSGLPKGVMITGENIHATAVNFGVLARVGHDSVFVCDAPMFHVIGMLPGMQAPLLFGAALHICPGFDPARTNALLGNAEVGATHYFCVPKMADMLAEHPDFAPATWRRLQALFTGGSPLAAARVHEWLARGVLISNGYGMTEAGTLCHVPLERERVVAMAGSVGLPGPRMAYRLVDADNRPVAPGQPGEILVKGPNVTLGYWERPAETAAAFTPNGWLRTGDIGRIEPSGALTLLDRKKDMYISGGENVFPAEVEQVLAGFPGLIEAAVVGVADAHWGEVGHAHVVLENRTLADAEALRRHCRERLAGYKVPQRIHFHDALPRNASGKLRKARLSVD